MEFSDLLPQSNLRQQQEEEYVMKSFGKNKMATYTRNQNKRNLPFFLWLEACDIFTSIYVERATSRDAMLKTLKSLLTYKKNHTHEKIAIWLAKLWPMLQTRTANRTQTMGRNTPRSHEGIPGGT